MIRAVTLVPSREEAQRSRGDSDVARGAGDEVQRAEIQIGIFLKESGVASSHDRDHHRRRGQPSENDRRGKDAQATDAKMSFHLEKGTGVPPPRGEATPEGLGLRGVRRLGAAIAGAAHAGDQAERGTPERGAGLGDGSHVQEQELAAPHSLAKTTRR